MRDAATDGYEYIAVDRGMAEQVIDVFTSSRPAGNVSPDSFNEGWGFPNPKSLVTHHILRTGTRMSAGR